MSLKFKLIRTLFCLVWHMYIITLLKKVVDLTLDYFLLNLYEKNSAMSLNLAYKN
jgi:hypothetical protein